jgi:F-type H+-transporting ATPase subunit delta
MTSRTSATRYARALLDVAIKEADPQHVEAELTAVTDTFTGHADLWKVLTSPAVPSPKKRAIVEDLLSQLGAGPVVGKLTQLLADRDRLQLLPGMLEAYRSRLLDYQQVVRAKVTTAMPLADTEVSGLQESLARLTGRKVIMSVQTSPELMGGVVTQIGSTVYDGSVKRQLEKMKARLEQAI